MIKDVIMHDLEVSKENAKGYSGVVPGSLDLPSLFDPDRPPRRFVEFIEPTRSPTTRRAYVRTRAPCSNGPVPGRSGELADAQKDRPGRTPRLAQYTSG